ncbi:MAG: cupredoxin domain-containing protein [Chloroflexota bacterium]|nr:cupredoxin domain-containing protein [Chloroflexota bacterium]
MKRNLTGGLLALAAMLALIVSPGLSRAQSSQQVTLTLSEFMISPMTVNVPMGQPVHFIANNTGKYPHNVTFVVNDSPVTLFAQPLAGGASGEADMTFTAAGTWRMFCPVDSHADKGMVGQLIVAAAAAQAAPTAADSGNSEYGGTSSGASGASSNVPGMPTTGQGSDSSLPLAGVAGLALLVSGLVVRRRLAGRKI